MHVFIGWTFAGIRCVLAPFYLSGLSSEQAESLFL